MVELSACGGIGDMGVLDAKPAELEAFLSSRSSSIHPDVAGPFRVVSVARTGQDAIRCELTAYRLIPVDPADPALFDVSVPVPVSGWIELRADGSVAASSLQHPGPEEVREARVFARDLIERGSVRGLSTGPGGPLRGRPTHALEADAAGRRIIRRIGYNLR